MLLRIAAPALFAALVIVAFLASRMRASSPAAALATTVRSPESGTATPNLEAANAAELPIPAPIEKRSAVAGDPPAKIASSPGRVRLVGDVHDRQGRPVAQTSFLNLDTESG